MTPKGWYFYVEGLKGIRECVEGLVTSPGNEAYAAESLAGICCLHCHLALYPLIWRATVSYICSGILCVGWHGPFGYRSRELAAANLFSAL